MKMADFRVEVPLAALDEDCELQDYANSDQASTTTVINNNNNVTSTLDNRNNNPAAAVAVRVEKGFCSNDDDSNNEKLTTIKNGKNSNNSANHLDVNFKQLTDNNPSPDVETFTETLSGSLEDLVGHFDEKITYCLKNFGESTEVIAPVQVRTQEEIMNESQIWWTLTGNYGNILPIDWSKSYAHKLQLPALHLRSKKDDTKNGSGLDLSDDEDLAHALDLHSLIFSSLATNRESPPQTADQVIEEIDEIMQQSYNSELTGSSDYTMESTDSSIYSPLKSPLPLVQQYALSRQDVETKAKEAGLLTGNPDKLKSLTRKKLNALHGELESLIQIYNETLVQELALRDELEYEKELKNTFISLVLSVQNKRRQYHLEKKRKNSRGSLLFSNGSTTTNGGTAKLPQFISTVVPYENGCGSLDNQSLQALIKILRAVNEDNPNVPNMLTDYILNVLCPSNGTTEAC